MSGFSLIYTRALRAHPSDNAVIASPSTFITSGTTTSITANKIVCSTATFKALNVRVGDVVHNDSAGAAATVTAVDSETTLTLNANIFTTASQTFAVYGMSDQSGFGSRGAYLYVGGVGDVTVITLGGETVTFKAVPTGTVLPIQVIQLKATLTTATFVNAMW